MKVNTINLGAGVIMEYYQRYSQKHTNTAPSDYKTPSRLHQNHPMRTMPCPANIHTTFLVPFSVGHEALNLETPMIMVLPVRKETHIGRIFPSLILDCFEGMLGEAIPGMRLLESEMFARNKIPLLPVDSTLPLYPSSLS